MQEWDIPERLSSAEDIFSSEKLRGVGGILFTTWLLYKELQWKCKQNTKKQANKVFIPI